MNESKLLLDFWAKDENGRYFHVREGTGDNLLQEDIDEGYIDYIYYEYFNSLQEIYDQSNDDGGMILLKTYYQDMTTEQIIDEVKNMEDIEELEVIEEVED